MPCTAAGVTPRPSPTASTVSIDISVDDFTTGCTTYGTIPGSVPVPWSRWDALINPVAPAGAGEIHIKRASALSYHIIAHEVFHLFEDAVINPDTTDQWLQEGLAEWAAVRADGAAGGLELNPDRTMDCVGSVCGDSEFDRNGYPGWMLFEYLAERFGDASVKSVLDTAAANPPPWTGTHSLSNVVQAHSTTLGKFFEDYTTARLTGNFTYAALAGVLPQTQGSIVVGSSTGRDLAGDARGQPPRRPLRGPRARLRLGHRSVLRSLTRVEGHAAGRRRLHAVLLRRHEGCSRSGVHGLRHDGFADRSLEHLRGQPARVRVLAERVERRQPARPRRP